MAHTYISLPKEICDTSKNNEKKLRIVCISDTHERHDLLLNKIPDGDVLVHCGDFTNNGGPQWIQSFNDFLGKLPHKYKVVICGNHETGLEYLSAQQIQNFLTNCIYLQDSSVEIEGVKFYGTPWTNCMGFFHNEKQRHDKWKQIPNDTDILLTHMPCKHILDLAWISEDNTSGYCEICQKKHEQYRHWGDKNLREEIMKRIKPIVHICGHVHDDHGFKIIKPNDSNVPITFINAAIDLYPHQLDPIVFDFPLSATKKKSNQQSTSMTYPISNQSTNPNSQSFMITSKLSAKIAIVAKDKDTICGSPIPGNGKTNNYFLWTFTKEGFLKSIAFDTYLSLDTKDNSLYLGITDDIKKQQWIHKDGYLILKHDPNCVIDLDIHDKTLSSIIVWERLQNRRSNQLWNLIPVIH